MNKKLRNLIIAGVVVLLLVGALLLLMFLPEKKEDTPSSAPAIFNESEEDLSVYLYESEEADIVSLTFEGDNIEKFQMERVDDHEFTIEKFNGLDQLTSNYDSLVHAYATFLAERTANENPEDISIYGLDDPSLTVEVAYKDGTTRVVKFGDAVPTGDGYYVALEGNDAVYVARNDAYTLSARRAEQYLSVLLLDVWEPILDKDGNVVRENPIIDYLEIEGGSFRDYGLFRMEYQTEEEKSTEYASNYMVVSPFVAELAVNNDDEGNDMNLVYTDRFSTFSAANVAIGYPTAEELTACGFDEPYAVIRFSREGEEHVWTIGGETATAGGAKAYYVTVDEIPMVYVVAEVSLPWVTANINSMYSSLLLVPMINDVASVDVEVYGEKHTLISEGESSDMTAKLDGEDMDIANYRKMYQFLLSAPAEELNIGYTRGAKAGSITYHLRKGGSETLTFYEGGDRKLIISYNGREDFACRSAYLDTMKRNFERLASGEAPVIDY